MGDLLSVGSSADPRRRGPARGRLGCRHRPVGTVRVWAPLAPVAATRAVRVARCPTLGPGPARSVAQGPIRPTPPVRVRIASPTRSEGALGGAPRCAVRLARRRAPGSTTTRSKRTAAAARACRPGRPPRSSSPYAARRGGGPASGGRPSPRAARSLAIARQRTSTITSAAGGPGSTATRSSSWRPTWTFRARTVQPASSSRDGDQRLGGVAGLLGRGPRPAPRSADPWPRCVHAALTRPYRALTRGCTGARRASAELERREVGGVERRVVGHDRHELALEQLVGRRRRATGRRAGRSRAGRRRASAGARGTSAGGTASGPSARIASRWSRVA